MLDNITIGKYYNVDSKIHSLHPINKIISMILFIISIFMCPNLKFLILPSFLLSFLIYQSNIPIKNYLKPIYNLKILIISIVICNVLFKVSLETTILYVLKLVMIFLYSMILTLTTSPNDITIGLEKVFSPLKILKIPVNALAFSVTLAIRFIPMIIEETNTIMFSLNSRGIDYNKSSFKGKIRIMINMLVPMFAATIKRSDDLALSMELRLYKINGKRSSCRINKWNLYDSFIIMFHVIIILVMFKGVML